MEIPIPMKFADALKIANAPPPDEGSSFKIHLVCGCTAYHLQVFLTAHLRKFVANRHVTIETGLYGDCLGNLERAREQSFDGIAVVLEWSDLDPRLGLRQLGGWGPDDLADIAQNVKLQAARFLEALTRADEQTRVVLCLPTLPLPPLAVTPGWQMSEFEFELRGHVLELGARLARLPNTHVVHAERLAQISPPAERRDVRGELLTGFPYRLAHASAIAQVMGRLLQIVQPKKGLVTDLDDTLWRGLVGEIGPTDVSWHLENHSQAHGLYQVFLRALAEAGVLVAAASKNDPAVVDEVFRRDDILLPRRRVFPLEVHWGAKSESVSRVLQAWNIGADSVVFIDDNPIELAEVQAAHPGIETILFPKGQDQAIYDLLEHLRDLFGKRSVGEEDRLRLDSLRRAANHGVATALAKTDMDQFLRTVEAEVTLNTEKEPPDPRALELVNKTNQFNLNGRRFTEREWRAYLQQPDAFLYLVSYRDRFGPLGKIAVLAGRHSYPTLHIDVWVMSCRAFSRRIEHKCLDLLFEYFAEDEIAFDFQETDRNGPIRQFFESLLPGRPSDPTRLKREEFASQCPMLFHEVKVASNV